MGKHELYYCTEFNLKWLLILGALGDICYINSWQDSSSECNNTDTPGVPLSHC